MARLPTFIATFLSRTQVFRVRKDRKRKAKMGHPPITRIEDIRSKAKNFGEVLNFPKEPF